MTTGWKCGLYVQPPTGVLNQSMASKEERGRDILLSRTFRWRFCFLRR
jgi:hypothetical protein